MNGVRAHIGSMRWLLTARQALLAGAFVVGVALVLILSNQMVSATTIIRANDTFTDASSTLLENHTPDTGTGWSVSAASEIEIQSNRASLNGPDTSIRVARETTDLLDDDMDVTADLELINPDGNGPNNFAGITARNSSADFLNYYLVTIEEDDDNFAIALYKVVGGTKTLLGTRYSANCR